MLLFQFGLFKPTYMFSKITKWPVVRHESFMHIKQNRNICTLICKKSDVSIFRIFQIWRFSLWHSYGDAKIFHCSFKIIIFIKIFLGQSINSGHDLGEHNACFELEIFCLWNNDMRCNLVLNFCNRDFVCLFFFKCQWRSSCINQ